VFLNTFYQVLILSIENVIYQNTRSRIWRNSA